MKTKPLVSVVIPAFNHAGYLGAALKSVLCQSYPAWEAIIVDDGSTDETAYVAASFHDPRVRYVYQNNLGASAARNHGIQVTQGKYLAFLDADDELIPTFMERCAREMESDPCLDGVYSRNYFVDSQGRRLPQVGGSIVDTDHIGEQLLEGGFFAIHSAMIRRSSLFSDLPFDPTCRSQEDWAFWLEFSRSRKMRGIPEPLVSYRVYHYSTSEAVNKSMLPVDYRMANRIQILTRHLGEPIGSPESWPLRKRKAFAYAHRQAALDYFLRQDAGPGWQMAKYAFELWPALFTTLDTHFELICAEQRLGYRGQADRLDIPQREQDLMPHLVKLVADDYPQGETWRRKILGNAYLALAILSDQSLAWPQARGYLLRALRLHPGLASRSVMRRLLKLTAGRRMTEVLGRILPVRYTL